MSSEGSYIFRISLDLGVATVLLILPNSHSTRRSCPRALETVKQAQGKVFGKPSFVLLREPKASDYQLTKGSHTWILARLSGQG